MKTLGAALAVLAFAADRAHKWWMLDVFDIGTKQPVTVFPGFDLVMAWNEGVSYGLLTTHKQGALIGISVLITAVLVIWLARATSALTAAALGLVIGGALSNALDRALYGAVADFFHLHWQAWSWYIFNVADIAIVAGVALLLYESFRERKAQ